MTSIDPSTARMITSAVGDPAVAGDLRNDVETDIDEHHQRHTGVDKGGTPPPNCRAKKNFLVKKEGLLEPVVLILSFRVRSNAMFTSERRY